MTQDLTGVRDLRCHTSNSPCAMLTPSGERSCRCYITVRSGYGQRMLTLVSQRQRATASGQGVTQELELPGVCLAGQAGRVSVESVHSFGIDGDVGPVAGRSPALGHEERIVDQAVHGADCEQRRRHFAKTSVERRYVGVPALLKAGAGEEVVAEPMDDRQRKNQVAVAPQDLARRAIQIVRAVNKVGGGDSILDPVPVAQPQKRHHGQMRSRRLTADGKPSRSIEQRISVLEEMEHGVLTVVRAGGVRVLRGEPVADARGAEAGLVGEQLQPGVLHVMRTEGPASAVDVEVDTRRCLVGTDDSHFDRTAAARDLDVSRVLQEYGRREDPLAFSPHPARDLRWERVHRWLAGDEGFELRVECSSLVYVLLLDAGGGRLDRGHWAKSITASAAGQRTVARSAEGNLVVSNAAIREIAAPVQRTVLRPSRTKSAPTMAPATDER